MLTLTEQYIINEKLSDLWKPSKERGEKWSNRSADKSLSKIYGKYGTGKYKNDDEIRQDAAKGVKRAKTMGKVGKHIGQAGGVALVGGLTGAAYLAYKLYKKWKNKEKEADTPEEKELFRKKAEAAKAQSQKLKAKKG